MPKAEAARTYRVSLSTVKRYAHQSAATGTLAPKPRHAPSPRISAAHLPALQAQLEAAPDATLAEHCQTWAQTQGMVVSVPTMWRAIERLGWSTKKKS